MKILDESLTIFATVKVVTNDAWTEGRSGELDPSGMVMTNELTEQPITMLGKCGNTILVAEKYVGGFYGDAAKHKRSAFAEAYGELVSQSEAVANYVFVRFQSLITARTGEGAL